MGAEESDDRMHSVRWSELTLHILLCNLTNSCKSWNKTRNSFFFGLLTQTETSRSHSCVESVSWCLRPDRYCNLIIPRHRKQKQACLSSWESVFFAFTLSVIFSRDSEMSVSVDVGQDARFGRLLPATVPPRESWLVKVGSVKRWQVWWLIRLVGTSCISVTRKDKFLHSLLAVGGGGLIESCIVIWTNVLTSSCYCSSVWTSRPGLHSKK